MVTVSSGHRGRAADVPELGLIAARRTPDGPPSGVAAKAAPVLRALIGQLPVRFSFWDGSVLGPVDAPGWIHVRTPDAIRRIAWAPGELGAGRAFVAGDIDFEGDVFDLISLLRPAGVRLHDGLVGAAALLRGSFGVGAVGRPLPAPPEEVKPRGRLHSRRRDAAAISHHYDVGNDFYRLVLGESMTYSCGRFIAATDTLERAQEAKHELVCRKLGLHERAGMRLLDVGCGWGSMAIHAARHHGAEVVGITISREQAELARTRVAEASLSDRVEIRLQDYRDLRGERFDGISSIGMFEHVGAERTAEYFATLRAVLSPRGRLLNHAISSIGGSKPGPNSFVHRYVFPDGDLLDVGEVALAMERAGFEMRDVESLREHYAETLRRWVANLQARWDEAVEQVGEGRARVWLLYMAASSIGFADGGLGIHQVLGAVPDDGGRSGMPRTRHDWR
jgi:cyclopropane-fatty-acyl-phospholipid synthase